MKTITKFLLAGTALAAAGANAATINVLPTAPGGSDLVLFVTDTSNNATFVQDLGVNVDSLGVTTASVASDVTAGNNYSIFGTATVGPLSNPVVSSSIINSSGADTALQAFLTANSGGNFIWGVEGAATGDGTIGAGQSRTVATIVGSPAQVAADAISGTSTTAASHLFLNEPNSVTANGAATAVNSFFPLVNAGTNTPYGVGTNNGGQAAVAIGASSTAGLGTSMYLYELASTGGSNDANFYGSTVKITVNTDGTISGISSGSGTTVPLPAAIWLLGSGVLGLFGIGRRRSVAVA
jgi:hypothetical protein